MRNRILLAAFGTIVALAGCTADNRADVRENVQGVRQQVRSAAEEARIAAQNASTEGKIKAVLEARKGLDADHIEVEVKAGHALLKGDVASREQAELAERVVAETEGVTSVDNQLMIRVPARDAPATTIPVPQPDESAPALEPRPGGP